MSAIQTIRTKLQQMEPGEPFTSAYFLEAGSRAAVDKALSRLVAQGTIQRIARGVFVQPKTSRFVGAVAPDIDNVVKAIARDHGETIQLHGAEAARRFKLSTQMPTIRTYYTNRASRTILVGKLKVKLMHTTNQRKLQHAGSKAGMALSALWYIGKENINSEVILRIKDGLDAEEFETLCNLRMPAWMSNAINDYNQGQHNA